MADSREQHATKQRLDHTDECIAQHQLGEIDCICGAFDEQRLAGAAPRPTPQHVGWNEDLRPQFEAEAKRFHVDLEMREGDPFHNYKRGTAKIAWIMFQFGYHLAAKIPVRAGVAATVETPPEDGE